jgi:cytochrome P450
MLALEDQIREFCVRSLDPLIGAGGFDFIADIGAQMPMRVIGMLLGIPEADQESVRNSANANIRTKPGQPQEFRGEFDPARAFKELGDYLDYRTEHPSDDLMTELVHAEFEDEHGVTRRLTRQEALTYVSVIAGAGNETTTRLIGWAGKTLCDHPDQRRDLAEDLSLVPNAIEELLRYEPPPPHVGRYVTRDVVLYGQTVPEGSAILMLVGAANRDDRRYPNGDSFDIHRSIGQHLAFGYGIHFCLGAALARLEGQVTAETLVGRVRTITPAGAMVRKATPPHAGPALLRGVARLPVHVEAN